MKTKLLTTTLFWLCVTAVAQSGQPHRKPFVTSEPMVHDPVMAYEDSTYHLFCTGMGIQRMTSRDGLTWTVCDQPVMTVIPKWTHDSVPGFQYHVWAPDVMRWHDRWWLAYSCSTFGRNTSAIGLLSARSLSDAIWQDEGCIVASRGSRDQWNAIDPCFVVDEADQPWLFWGSFWDGIQMVRLDTTLHLAAGEQPRTIARRYDVNDPQARARLPINPNPPKDAASDYAGPNAIEAPFVFRHDGWYYLFVSWDYCCQGSKSNYAVAVGRSRQVDGPYLDREGRDMRLGGGTIILEGDKQHFEATGHCAAYHLTTGEDVFICHGYSVAHHGAPILIRRTIRWTADAWPELSL